MEEEPKENFETDEADFLEAKIDNISVSNLGFIVFLKVIGDHRVLPIFIGANEAQSIALAYNNQVPPRPLTHDLMKTILGMLDCEVTRVQVTGLSENTFFGRIFLKKEGIEEMDVDARPSDALALALRYQAPIFIHKDVYASAAIEVKDSENPDANTNEGSGVDEGATPDEGAVENEKAASPESGVKITKPSQSKALEQNINPVERLKAKLQKALEAEHYEEAARLRDELKRIQSGN